MDYRAILAQGIEHWNRWRSHHPDSTCILESADLRQDNLVGGNFRGVKFKAANLQKVDLTDADLTNADLTGVDLTGANLSNTILYGANLSGANLAKAFLDNTDLRTAHLTDAWLVETDIRSVKMTGLSEPYPTPVAVQPFVERPVRPTRKRRVARTPSGRAISTPAISTLRLVRQPEFLSQPIAQLKAFVSIDSGLAEPQIRPKWATGRTSVPMRSHYHSHAMQKIIMQKIIMQKII